eukprot:1159778-Rhodomonas_salina.1
MRASRPSRHRHRPAARYTAIDQHQAFHSKGAQTGTWPASNRCTSQGIEPPNEPALAWPEASASGIARDEDERQEGVAHRRDEHVDVGFAGG